MIDREHWMSRRILHKDSNWVRGPWKTGRAESLRRKWQSWEALKKVSKEGHQVLEIRNRGRLSRAKSIFLESPSRVKVYGADTSGVTSVMGRCGKCTPVGDITEG